MLNHSDWEALRDKVALQIYIKECAQLQIPSEEAEKRWQAMPEHGSLSRRVELRYTAGFALIALEEMGYLGTESGPRLVPPRVKRKRAGNA